MLPIIAAQGLRAIAPDMIGFGRSDKPCRRTDHAVGAHVAALGELVVHLELSHITLVVQDWGGPIGLAALVTAPERFSGVVAANTALHTADPDLAGLLAWPCHQLEGGSMAIEPTLLDYQRLTQELAPFRPSLFVQGATTHKLSEGEYAAYDAPFPDEASCAGPRQLPLLMGLSPRSACAQLNRRTFEFLAHSPMPVLTAYSDGDPSTGGWDRVLQARAAGAAGQGHCTIADAGHFLQEDQGPNLAEKVVAFATRSQS
jgi:haloalkane dehalogenase